MWPPGTETSRAQTEWHFPLLTIQYFHLHPQFLLIPFIGMRLHFTWGGGLKCSEVTMHFGGFSFRVGWMRLLQTSHLPQPLWSADTPSSMFWQPIRDHSISVHNEEEHDTCYLGIVLLPTWPHTAIPKWRPENVYAPKHDILMFSFYQ